MTRRRLKVAHVRGLRRDKVDDESDVTEELVDKEAKVDKVGKDSEGNDDGDDEEVTDLVPSDDPSATSTSIPTTDDSSRQLQCGF
jgi:hypothetical protein